MRKYREQQRAEKEEKEYERAYWQALQEGEAKNNRIPIMLIGQGRSGKTSLMRRLLGLPFDEDQPSTTGIDVVVIELTEGTAEYIWENKELKFMIDQSEAKAVIYKKTVEYYRKQGDIPNQLNAVSKKTLSFEEMMEIQLQQFIQHDQKESLRVFLSDFAGQSIYYDTHGCFVKPHCPYVLVYDLSLEFDKPAVLKFKNTVGKREIELNNSHLNTNLDLFTFWLKFLQGLGECQDQQTPGKSVYCTTAKGENFKLPPVLIALTHSDKVKENVSKIDYVQMRINNVISEGKYENVVPKFFLIDNTLEGDEGDDVRKLRRNIFEFSSGILDKERPMPLKWMDIERALSHKLSSDIKYISVDEAKQIAKACGIRVGEFDQAIKFLHRLGVVVYFSGSSKVVLDPHWLMDRFTKVISMPIKLDAASRLAFEMYEKKGILCQEYLERLEDAELLEELMQKFNLICSCQHDGKAAFYVPSVAPAMKAGEELEADLSLPSLFVTFPRQLVPMSLFTKLQVKLISEWKRRFPKQQVTPSFYCNYSLLPLFLDGNLYDVRLIDLHEFVKVTVFPKRDGNHTKFANCLLAILKTCLDDLKSPDQLLFGMTSYDLEVKCTCCYGKEEKCSRHDEVQCHSDRCGHFWKLSDLQEFYHNQSPAVCRSDECSSKMFDIESVKIWLTTDTRSKIRSFFKRLPSVNLQRLFSKQVPVEEVPGAATAVDNSKFRSPKVVSSEASTSSEVLDAATAVDNSNFGSPNVVSNETSTSSEVPDAATAVDKSKFGSQASTSSEVPATATAVDNSNFGSPNVISCEALRSSEVLDAATAVDNSNFGSPNVVSNETSTSSEVPDIGTAVDNSKFGSPNVISTEASTSSESMELWEWEEKSIVHREKFIKLRQCGKDSIKEVSGARVCCSKEFLIGKGSDGTRVYVGLGKDGYERAVKCLPKDACTELAKREKEVLNKLNTTKSNYVVNYWFLDEQSDERCLLLILDLCEETLADFVANNSLEKLVTIAPDIILQVLKGLADLHRDEVLHRDLRPSNILRDVNDNWLLADFGISQILTTGATTHESRDSRTGHWKAVESCSSNSMTDDVEVEYTKESDIQVAGMVAFYLVTKGQDVFGEERYRLGNLLDGNPVGLDTLKDPVLKDLLSWMLSHDPKDRPSAEEAQKHPYFMAPEEQFEMLCTMGNEKEIKNSEKSSAVVRKLNNDPTDWRMQMRPDVLKYLCTDFMNGKPKIFSYKSSWTECLRLIRNVNQHWHDRPRPLPQPEAYYIVEDPQKYFLKLFPHLPVEVHRIVRSCDWKERPNLKKYFA